MSSALRGLGYLSLAALAAYDLGFFSHLAWRVVRLGWTVASGLVGSF